jgi:hypothetical protein
MVWGLMLTRVTPWAFAEHLQLFRRDGVRPSGLDSDTPVQAERSKAIS